VDSVAVELEQKYTDLKGRLIAAIQFARMTDDPGFSRELIESTHQQALERAGLIEFSSVVSYSPLWKTGRLLLAPTVLALALLFIAPGLFTYSYEVWSDPTKEVGPPISYTLTPIPGSTEWVKYRDISIGGALVGLRLPDKATIHYRLVGGNWQTTTVEIGSLPHATIRFGDSVQFATTMRQINKSFDYYVEAGKLKTEEQKIDVVDRPRVNGISLSVFYPDYTGLKPTTLDEKTGSFSAVVGSRANIKVEANLSMQKAELVWDDSSRTPMSVQNKTAETAIQIDKSRSYYIHLEDHLGESNPDPIQYYVTAVPDEYPSIDVLYPGFDANLTDDMAVPFKLHIADDYGFTSLMLKYVITSQGGKSKENVAVLHYSDRIKTEGDIEFNWDVGPLNLYPGDFVTYHFEIADNDRISGPKISRTRDYIARVPSVEELAAQMDQDSKQRISNTENIIKSGKDLTQRLRNAARKLEAQSKQNTPRDADWQQQKELEAIAQKNLEMTAKIDTLAQQMDKSLDKLKENSLLSREIMEKMQQIQKLFEEVATPEMKEAQQKLMDALKNMDPQKLKEAMDKFQMSQKEMMERLERTLALLKKIQLEQKMEAMIRKAEDLAKRQEAMNNKTDQSSDQALPKLSKPEDDLRESLEQLKKEVADFEQIAKEAKMSEQAEVQKFSDAVKNSDAQQNMQNMSQALSDQKKQDAKNEGKQALSKLMQMLNQMQSQQNAMKQNGDNASKQAMRRALEDANYLSQAQESLMTQAAAIDPRSVVLHDMAQAQQDLAASCNGLKNTIAELGKKSPFVAAELSALLNGATGQMENATSMFDQKNGFSAMNNQRDAMVSLNRAATRLMESLDQQSQCNKAGSCDKNMSQLESLCNKQNQLNQQTQKQCNNPQNPGPGEKAQETRNGMERLAGEQGTIRKSLEELEKEFGGSRQIMGRLSDIANEMRRIEEELSSGQAGQETVERQLKIYSRMLEASRSLQRKDFTEERKATSASTKTVFIPQGLPVELLNDRTPIEDRLREFLGKDYPPQYEEQIKAYFRALLKTESPAQPPAGTPVSPNR
ncbi:MAG: hypothetical protein HY851_10475, partial [candidate division Zixibacteria bacterium]|nr:hypothetical protein [candidate division Zixibacteria bacterium]